MMNNLDIVQNEAHMRFCHLESIINSCTTTVQMRYLPEYMFQLVRQLRFIIKKNSKQLNIFKRASFIKECEVIIHKFSYDFWDAYTNKVNNI